jgi:hypothetical protein
MNLLLWGITFGTVGKLVLGIAVLRVHVWILREHKIDGVVLRSIKREQFVTLAGLLLIIIGFVFEVMFYGSATDFFSCADDECVATVTAAFFSQ